MLLAGWFFGMFSAFLWKPEGLPYSELWCFAPLEDGVGLHLDKEVRVAEGLDAELVRAVVARDFAALPADVSLAMRFAEQVLAREVFPAHLQIHFGQVLEDRGVLLTNKTMSGAQATAFTPAGSGTSFPYGFHRSL